MQRDHILMLRFKWNRIQPGKVNRSRVAHVRVVANRQPRLPGCHDECNFGRIALGAPDAIGVAQIAVVAQQPPCHDLDKRRVLREIFDDLAVELDFPNRCISCACHPISRPGHVDLLNGHLILSECPGLIRADDRHAAQGFHRGQLAYDRAALRHARHPNGKRHSQGSRQPFRDHGYCQRDGCRKRIDNRLSAQHADREGDGSQRQDCIEHQPAELADLSRQWGFQLSSRGDQLRDATHLSIVPGRDYHASARSVSHKRRCVRHVVAIREARFRGQELVSVLLHRHRLAGERRLRHLQISRTDQPQVGRRLVARLQHHQVSRHQLGSGNALRLARADHSRLGRHGLCQCFDGPLRAGFLDEADDGIDQHHCQDNSRIDDIFDNRGDDRGHQEDVDQWVVELKQKAEQGALAPFRCQHIAAKTLLPVLDLENI